MRQRYGLALAAAGTALILAATLRPVGGVGPEQPSFWCLVCGARGVAAGFLNILLFVPFGWGLALLKGPVLAVGASFGLSSMVELIQTTLPGRHSALGDIVANTAGGALGAGLFLLHTRIAYLLQGPPLWLKLAAALLPTTVFAATAVLSAPTFPDGEYHGQWTRRLGTLKPYPGKVISAFVGELPLPDHRLPNQDAVREAFRSGEPLLVEAVAGTEPAELSHLFAVYDDRRREVVLVTVQGSDLFFQRETRSVRLLLDPPFVRWNGAIRQREGDTLRIMVRQEARASCMELDAQVRCDLSGGTGAGWRLLYRLRGARPALVTVLSLIWLSALSFPAGAVLGGLGRGVFVGLALGVSGILVSWWSPWLSPQLIDLLGPLPGAWAGWAVRQRMARKVEFSEPLR